MRSMSPLASVQALFLLAACGTASSDHRLDVPAALRPPADQVAYLEVRASGVQIYECSQQAGASYQWTFKAPEAALATRSGESVGKHYAGPTWEARDGSTVVGDVKARDPGPVPSAIPWLLLTAKTNSGTGVFGNAKSIQRIATQGGLAPGEPCDANKLHRVARVPYTASYVFYR